MTIIGIAHDAKIESIGHGWNDTALETRSPGIGASRSYTSPGTAIL
jgi:hypothetical protein